MIVSQLKSVVFTIQQTMAKASPVEESLRQLAKARQQGTDGSPALIYAETINSRSCLTATSFYLP